MTTTRTGHRALIISSAQHLYEPTSGKKAEKQRNTSFPLLLSLKTESVSPAPHSIRPSRSNSKPHEPPVSQVQPRISRTEFFGCIVHTFHPVPCLYRCDPMCTRGVLRSPTLKPKTWCWSKASALEQGHLFWLFFFSSMGIRGNISICWPYGSTLVSAGTSVGLSPLLPPHTAPPRPRLLSWAPRQLPEFCFHTATCVNLMLCNRFQRQD